MKHYVAQPFVAGTPEAEVTGAAMIAFAENLEADAIQPTLKKFNLKQIDPDEWYPHQLWMDILKDVEDRLGDAAQTTLTAFGRQVVESAVMPPEIQTIPDVLHALHAIHHANLRNIPQEEGYFVEARGEKHYVVYHNTPNPELAIYGFLWGLAGRFKQPDEIFVVERLETNDKPDRARSAYSIRWGSHDDDL